MFYRKLLFEKGDCSICRVSKKRTFKPSIAQLGERWTVVGKLEIYGHP